MKAIATWIIVIGSILLGISIFFAGVHLIATNLKISEKQGVTQQALGLYEKIQRTCISGGIGETYYYNISLPDVVRAVYIANAEEEPPDKVSVLISEKSIGTGNYFCLQFFDELPRCKKIDCQVNMTYIGSPSLKEDLFSLLAKIAGERPVYNYTIIINKTGYHSVLAVTKLPPQLNITTTTLPTITVTTTTTTSTTTTIINKTDVLIVALKSNMKEVYSDAQIQSLENKAKDYITAINNDGLKGMFLYLDENETSNIIGSKVTQPKNWNNIDSILDQLISRVEAKYLLILGGYDRFLQPIIDNSGCPDNVDDETSLCGKNLFTDDPYGDYETPKNGFPDISVGRIPDPKNGDINVILNSLDTAIKLHNAGGIDISEWIQVSMFERRTDLIYGFLYWTSGECYACAVHGTCPNNIFDIISNPPCDSIANCYHPEDKYNTELREKSSWKALLHGNEGRPFSPYCHSISEYTGKPIEEDQHFSPEKNYGPSPWLIPSDVSITKNPL
ncbi:MAG: hypothetical protein QXQ40_02370, partial [Candidatus Aenigmatarchaeota archaeon]